MIKKYYNIGKNELFSLCRSITGNGTHKTLKIIKREFRELKIKKIKSGTNVFDWKIPPEWNVKDAYVIDKYKKKIINFKNNNLHLISYSQNINKIINKAMLLKHIYSLPKQPDAIPYITSYYKKHWGFCITDLERKKIIKKYRKNDQFKVFIDTKFNNKGYLRYGELVIKGKSKQEILISTYICHPSMANNELSGPIVSMGLINYFKNIRDLKKTIRFLFLPETIGSITYINKNLKKLKKNVIGGYNLTCIGDDKDHSCIFTKYENTLSDYALKETYKKLKIKYKKYSFLERGSDERQYNSPGVDLPIASIFRSKYGEYPEYHTSLDNFNFISLKGLNGGYKVALLAIKLLQNKIIPINNLICEPFLSKRKLYPTLSTKTKNNFSQSLLDFLQYSDGKNDLKKIGELIVKNRIITKKIYNILKKNKLIN